jgi:hypothetical protein
MSSKLGPLAALAMVALIAPRGGRGDRHRPLVQRPDIDAKWGHFGADHGSKATPPKKTKAPPWTYRRPGASPSGSSPASAWPQGQRPHPVIGFSEVTLTEQRRGWRSMLGRRRADTTGHRP